METIDSTALKARCNNSAEKASDGFSIRRFDVDEEREVVMS